LGNFWDRSFSFSTFFDKSTGAWNRPMSTVQQGLEANEGLRNLCMR
jgi:hypothetical protein